MCHNLNVFEIGLYDWQGRSKSSRRIAKEKLMTKIRELFDIKHKQMAGISLITEDLHDGPQLATICRSRIAALMKEMGLRMQDTEAVYSYNRFRS
jgi:hypothetical protein